MFDDIRLEVHTKNCSLVYKQVVHLELVCIFERFTNCVSYFARPCESKQKLGFLRRNKEQAPKEQTRDIYSLPFLAHSHFFQILN